MLGLFHGFPDWGRVLATETVQTVRLDDVPQTAGADLLKLDIQGAELLVLRHAEARLRDALVVQAEVEFLPMYIGQPLFAEVETFLRRHGFMFHRFFPQNSRVLRPLLVDNNMYAGLSQLLWADAIFLRDITDLARCRTGSCWRRRRSCMTATARSTSRCTCSPSTTGAPAARSWRGICRGCRRSLPTARPPPPDGAGSRAHRGLSGETTTPL